MYRFTGTVLALGLASIIPAISLVDEIDDAAWNRARRCLGAVGLYDRRQSCFQCDQEITFETFQQQTSLSCPDSDICCNGNDYVEIDRGINNGMTKGLAP